MVLAPPRHLPYPLDYQAGMVVDTPTGEETCGLPTFPEDSDEKITVLFRLSLNEFVRIASTVDVGSDLAYGEDGLKVWWTWIASVMCASFCEEMAECVSDPESPFVSALADALRNNPLLAAAIAEALPETGVAAPGKSLTPGQAATSILPPEVKDEFGDCIPDALWGACLYLVQSGNRAITDFFEILESASNTLEASGIIASAIPAAGQYAGAAAEFADQMAENIAEGYSAAYTEDYENDLACAIFCAAMEGCELTPDMLIDILNARMPELIDVATFGLLMAQIGTIIIPPESIADTAFLVYFTALKFGQQFGEVVGIRPLTDLMSLGADQLASNNWEVLCECGAAYCGFYDFTIDDYSFVPGDGFGSSTSYIPGTGFRSTVQPGQFVDVMRDIVPDGDAPGEVTVFFEPADGSGVSLFFYLFLNGGVAFLANTALTPGQTEQSFDISYVGLWDRMYIQIPCSAADGTNVVTGVQFTGDGTPPSWLSDSVEC